MSDLILTRLEIRMENWGENAGKYTGRVWFGDSSSNMDFQVNQEISQQIIKLVADQLIESASKVAKAMVSPIIEAKTLKES